MATETLYTNGTTSQIYIVYGVSQNKSALTSTVTVSAYWKKLNSYANGYRSSPVTFDITLGGNKKSTSWTFDLRSASVGATGSIGSHSVTLKHDSSGNLTNPTVGVYCATGTTTFGTISGSTKIYTPSIDVGPSMPSSFGIPSLTYGEYVSLSWGASSGGGTLTYLVQRDTGSGFSNAGRVSGTSFSEMISPSWSSVRYRVRAEGTGTSSPWNTWSRSVIPDYNRYTVRFYDDDYTLLKSQTVNEWDNASPPSSPSKTGYLFNGWSGSYTNITSNVNIYATYVTRIYTVWFDDHNGATLKSQTVSHGGSATPPTPSTKTGYTFVRWSGNYTNVTSNEIITPIYTINTYTVWFNDYDNSTIKSETVSYGSSATAPSNPYRAGYTFAGWDTSYSYVTSSRVVKATYTINSYTVRFRNYDGITIVNRTVNYGGSATPPANPTRTGYTFAGWSGNYSTVYSDVTITATFTINSYQVLFKDWDGTTLSTQSINYGGNATLPPNPSRAGYTFNGWDKSHTNISSATTINASYTYIPKPAELPSFISYSEVRGGEDFTISWGVSNLATSYKLMRSLDGGTYEEVYQGVATSFIDNVAKGSLSIQYKVRGYNLDGYSNFREGNLVYVKNFPELNIKISNSVKVSTEGWVKIGEASRAIDSITLKIDGVLKEL